MSRPPWRVGLIGAGMFSAYHLDGWARRPDARVAAICDPDRARAAARAGEHGIPAPWDDAAAMLAGEALDLVDVVSPREHHAAHVRLAVARGLPVLCQKPLTPTLAEAEALVAGLPPGARLMVHENWRFRAPYRLMRRWLADGRLGRLVSLVVTVRSAGMLPDADGLCPALERQPFMRAVPRLAVAESLIHQLDVVRYLAGPLAMDAAMLARRCPDVVGEDRATLVMRTPEGAPVTVDGDMAAPGYPARTAESCELVGTRATALFRDLRLTLTGGGESESIAYDREGIYRDSVADCIGHFVESVAAGAPFETAPADNLETLRLVEDAYRLGLPMRDLAS